VCVCVRAQRESARVLTTASAPDAPDVRVVRATDIQRALKTRNMKASDMYGNEVRTVRIILTIRYGTTI
jgi:hypothetical protein